MSGQEHIVGSDGLGIGFQPGQIGAHKSGVMRRRFVEDRDAGKRRLQSHDAIPENRNLRLFRRPVFQLHEHDRREPTVVERLLQTVAQIRILRAIPEVARKHIRIGQKNHVV